MQHQLPVLIFAHINILLFDIGCIERAGHPIAVFAHQFENVGVELAFDNQRVAQALFAVLDGGELAVLLEHGAFDAVDAHAFGRHVLGPGDGIEENHHARGVVGIALALGVIGVLHAQQKHDEQQKDDAQIAVFGFEAVVQIARGGQQQGNEGGENGGKFIVILKMHVVFKIKMGEKTHGLPLEKRADALPAVSFIMFQLH